MTFPWQKAQILTSHKSADTYVFLQTYFTEFHKLRILPWGCCEGGNEISCSLRGRKLFNELLHCQLLKTDSTLYTYHQLSTEWRVLSPFLIVHFLCYTSSFYILSLCSLMGRDSSVGIATRYRLDGPRIESRWWRVFPHQPRPALGPTQPPIQWVSGLSRG